MRHHAILSLFVFVAVFAVSGGAGAEERLAIFDTHVHYSREAWAKVPPAAIIAKLKKAGVTRALVSSTPDDGTLKLLAEDKARIVPELRPYRDRGDMLGWSADDAVLNYIIERLARRRYVGIGEFHLRTKADAQTRQMRRLVEIAVTRKLILHVHSGAGPVEALFELSPMLRILWAHAGFDEPPGTVDRMLERYPHLWTELSFRASDVAPDGRLDPDWRRLLLKHKDRFMIGTDTYVSSRWSDYGGLIDEHRRWLAQLPRPVAEAIAFGNAALLYGVATD